jgi:hypothetical protein
LARRAF